MLRYPNPTLFLFFPGMRRIYTIRYLSTSNFRLRLIRIRSKPCFKRESISSDERKLLNTDRVKNDVKTKLVKQLIPYKGRGICASDWFTKGEFVLRYSGELISRKEGLRREKLLEKKKSNACFLYFFSCDTRRLCIDATAEDGTWGRLVNHSRLRPNCRMVTLKIDGTPILALVASRDIVPGEEIVYDYGEDRANEIKESEWIENS